MNLEYTRAGRACPRTGDSPGNIQTCDNLTYAPTGRNSHIQVYNFKHHYEVWEYHYDDKGVLVDHCIFSSLVPPDRHFDE